MAKYHGGERCGNAGTRSRQAWLREASASKRSKSFCGAKPTQKLRWTDAWLRSVSPAMEVSREAPGVWAVHGGCQRGRETRGGATLIWRDAFWRLAGDLWTTVSRIGCTAEKGAPWRAGARSVIGRIGSGCVSCGSRSHGLRRQERADEDQASVVTVRARPRFNWLRGCRRLGWIRRRTRRLR